jgi:predicted O-methyltransferase YrrM
MFDFTSDYFSGQISNMKHCLKILGTIDHAIEIGSHEGRSACWIIQNMLSPVGKLYCIDPFNSIEMKQRFEKNVVHATTQQKSVEPIVDYSYVALAKLIAQRKQVDFIYIDGAHHNHEVMTDAVMSWKLLRDGGIMVFDDYFPLTDGMLPPSPRSAIDAFQGLFSEDFTLLFANTQLGVRKRCKEKGHFYAAQHELDILQKETK